MQAVGNEVIIAILLMIAPFIALTVYFWNSIKQTYLNQLAIPQIPVEPHQREQIRRQRNDNTCAICLVQPKQFQVSSTCGHSFCGPCIFQIVDRGIGVKVKCPLCRNDMSIMFKCFLQNPITEAGEQISNKIREYNILYDDNRPFIRRILEFPYILKRLISNIFSIRFILYFFRNIYFVRLMFLAFAYLIMPFDLLPQSLVGIIGYIDDFLIFILLASYIVTIVAVQYYRVNH